MRQRYKTARCVLQKDDRFLLAIHSSFWQKTHKRWGLPGGSIERREEPLQAARRELEEELGLYLATGDMHEVGVWHYKFADHIVYTAAISEEIDDYDTGELLDICWFTLAEIKLLGHNRALHAGYELDAVANAIDHRHLLLK